jgi:hypothetical protein
LSVWCRGFAGVVLATTTMFACTTLRRAGQSCHAPASSSALAPFPPARALALAGNYELTIVADSGPRPGHSARGSISIAPNDTLHRYYVNALGLGWRRRGDRPLIGWGEIRGEVGLMTAGTPIRFKLWRNRASRLASTASGAGSDSCWVISL